MLERPQRLRLPPPPTRRRLLARRVQARRNPARRLLQLIGRADQRALVTLRTHGHTELSDRFAQGLGLFGEMGVGWIALAGTGALLRPKERSQWLAAATVAPVAILANYSVKLTIGRQRPLLDDHPPLARAPSKLSFPSAHSTSSVAAAVVLGRVAPAARPALLGFAGAICACRPYLGMHYPSDVIAGATLGAVIGSVYPLPSARSKEQGARSGGLEERSVNGLATGVDAEVVL